MTETKTLTPEIEAVVEAARAWRSAQRPADSDPTKHFERCWWALKAGDLVKAVDALDAPKPVKPEEVEPGTRFRFARMGGADKGLMPCGTYRVCEYQDGRRHYYSEETHYVTEFHPDDRIIPLQAEDE